MPGDPFTHQAVRDALVIARAMRGTTSSARTVQDVLSRTVPHMTWPAARRASEHALLSPTMGVAQLATHVAEVVARIHLPALAARLAAVLRGTEDEPDAVSCAEAFRSLREVVRRVEPTADVAVPTRIVLEAVRDRARACTASLAGALDGRDFPDIAALSTDLLRLEALRWVVEVLGERRAVDEITRVSRHLARTTLVRATATIDLFLDERDLMRMFDAAAVVAQVDNLIVVVSRMLDAQVAGEDEPTAFVETPDEIAMRTFLVALGSLSGVLFGLVFKSTARAEADAFFRGLLRQIECLHRISRHLRHEMRPTALSEMDALITQSLHRLAQRLSQTLEEALEEDGPSLALTLGRAEELLSVLAGTGQVAATARLYALADTARRRLRDRA